MEMGHFIGDPTSQALFLPHQQIRPDDCAVAAQTSIINQYLEHPISEKEAVYDAWSNGWYAPGEGTLPENVGTLFDLYGIPNHRVEGASIEQLAAELQAGHRIVVGVNSDDLWSANNPEFSHWLKDNLGIDTPANHALCVTGINMNDPDHPMVVLNDSGVENGAANMYPLDQFMDAWGHGNFFYVATDAPPPGMDPAQFNLSDYLAEHVSGFDPSAFAHDVNQMATDLQVNPIDLMNNINWDKVLAGV